MAGELIPFGKYKGQPVEVVAQDQDYCDWLLAQPWFVERYAKIHTLIINQGGEPAETPEHNALQIRCLDDRFRLQVTRLALAFFHPTHWEQDCPHIGGISSNTEVTPYLAALGPVVFEHAGVDARWWVRPWLIDHTTTSAQWPTWIQHDWGDARATLLTMVQTFITSDAFRADLAAKHALLLAQLRATIRETRRRTRPYVTSDQERFWREDCEFLESSTCLDTLIGTLTCTGIAVSHDNQVHGTFRHTTGGSTVSYQLAAYGEQCCQTFLKAHAATFLHLDAHREYFAMTVTVHTQTWRQARDTDPISIECKPWMGDDYPAVLRQVTKLPGTPSHVVVLAGMVRSQTVPLEAIRQFFAHSGVCLLLVDEVEQAEPLVIDTLDTLPPAHEAYHQYALSACEECATMSTVACVPF